MTLALDAVVSLDTPDDTVDGFAVAPTLAASQPVSVVPV